MRGETETHWRYLRYQKGELDRKKQNKTKMCKQAGGTLLFCAPDKITDWISKYLFQLKVH